MREITTAPLSAWSRTFPAVSRQAREARRFLAEILDDRPADDAILCLSELVTNACLRSASAQHGGVLAVRVQLHGAHLRVEVCDEGGPWAGNQRGDAGRAWAAHRGPAGQHLGTQRKCRNRLDHLVRDGTVLMTASQPTVRGQGSAGSVPTPRSWTTTVDGT
jgi:anti-sigma regulatory factor (Ser/Thr protein kinase)